MAPYIKNNQFFIYSTILLILLFSLIFFTFISPSDQNILQIEKNVRNTISLKLSADDLVALNDINRSQYWINTELIESDELIFEVKIKSRYYLSGIDFQLNMDGDVYNLYQFTDNRRRLVEFLKITDSGKMKSSELEIVKLKINEVLIGIFILERVVYPQIRDHQGNYFQALDSDTHQMRKLFYEIKIGRSDVLNKVFAVDELSVYLVFLNLLGIDEEMDLGRMILFYDTEAARFRPFVSVGSLIDVLNLNGRHFDPSSWKWDETSLAMDAGQVQELMNKTRNSPYSELIAHIIGTHVRDQKGTATQ